MAALLLKIPGEDPAGDQSLQIDTVRSSNFRQTPDPRREQGRR